MEDEESSMDRDFINDNEMEEDEELPSNPYMTGFFERIEEPHSPQMDQPCSSNSLDGRQILQKVWKATEERLKAEGIVMGVEEAKKEEEWKRKLVEEDKKKKRAGRRNKREIATYVYSHYGQKYDNVR